MTTRPSNSKPGSPVRNNGVLGTNPTLESSLTPRLAPGALPQWNVYLHANDLAENRHLVRTLMQLVHLNFPAATDVLITAHTHGSALVLTTHKERAELFRSQFASRGYLATIAPATA